MPNSIRLPRAVQLLHLLDMPDERDYLHNVEVTISSQSKAEAVFTNSYILVRVLWCHCQNRWEQPPHMLYFGTDLLEDVARLSKSWRSSTLFVYGTKSHIEIGAPNLELTHYTERQPRWTVPEFPDWRKLLNGANVQKGPASFSIGGAIIASFVNYLKKVWGPTEPDERAFMHLRLKHTGSNGLAPMMLRPHRLNNKVKAHDGLLEISACLMPARAPK